MSPRKANTDLLGIYLTDHWAGAGAGVALARRILRNNRTTPWADELEWLVSQIESDEHVLVGLRASLGISGGGWKRLLARIVERIGRLKRNGGGVGYSPLSRVVELEAMSLGVVGKLRLWNALKSAPSLMSHAELGELEDRARNQLDLLASIHQKASDIAFGNA
jgi:hypothetical protein